ncbi:MAG: hypothetical protein ACPGYK_04755 [Flavobacteriales bacterium]
MYRSEHWNDMPDAAKLWVFTASRSLGSGEKADLAEQMNQFLEGWQAHGQNLVAGWSLAIADRVLLLAVDESRQEATGCSIDSFVGWLQELEMKWADFTWFNRHIIMYQNAKADWRAASLSDFWAMRKAGLVDGQTKLCDATVGTIGLWRGVGVIPFEKSWHQEMWS